LKRISISEKQALELYGLLHTVILYEESFIDALRESNDESDIEATKIAKKHIALAHKFRKKFKETP
jgi:hypothetical protein